MASPDRTHTVAGLLTCASHSRPRDDAAPVRALALYLDAGVARLRLGLDADVSAAVLLAIPVRVVARVPALVRDDGGDGLGRIGLDEEPVERGRGALGDGGGLVGGVGLVRVSAVDHPALRDMDTGSAAHASATRLWSQIPENKHRHSGTSFPSSTAACTQAAVFSGHRLRAQIALSSAHLRLRTLRDGNVRYRGKCTRPVNPVPPQPPLLEDLRFRHHIDDGDVLQATI